MGLFSNAQAINIFDSLACEQHILSAAIESVVSGLSWYQRVHEPVDDVLGDPDVEQDLIPSAVSLDRNYRSGTTLTAFYGSWARAISRHVQNQGFTNLDDYLSTKGINLHEHYNPLHDAVFGTGLDAINVFKGTECVLATTNFTGSGVCVFTDGESLGTGSGKFSSTNAAASELKAVVSSSVIGANDVLLKVVGTDESGSEIISDTLTVPNSSSQDTEVAVVASQPYLDVTSIQCAGGNNNDQVEIKNALERNLTECSGIAAFLESQI